MSSLGFNTSQPLIMHIDLNSCFARVEQQAFPHLRNRPVVVASYDSPRGIIVSPSTEAKEYGIRVGWSVREARAVCPSIIVRTPDSALIRDVHRKFRAIVERFCSSVTPRSIDECILDFRDMDDSLDRTGTSLEDVAQQIKECMHTELGSWITASVGIGPNRFLAKTAASLIKPDGLVRITHRNVEEVYGGLSLLDLYGVNTRTQARLAWHGIHTPLDFLSTPVHVLKHTVFSSVVGYSWYYRLRGWEVDGASSVRKTFGQQYAMKHPTNDEHELTALLFTLVEKMGRRLRRHALAAKGIHIACWYEDYTGWHLGRLASEEMHSTASLYAHACRVFAERVLDKVVRKISVTCFGLVPYPSAQMTLFDDANRARQSALSQALDRINNKYGEFTIKPARLVHTKNIVPDFIGFGNIRDV